MWPTVSLTPASGPRFFLSHTVFPTGGSVRFVLTTCPEGSVTPLAGDRLAFMLKTEQSTAPEVASSGLLEAYNDTLAVVLPIPDVTLAPDDWSEVLPTPSTGTDPFSPVPCRLVLARSYSGGWVTLASSPPCWVEPVAPSNVTSPTTPATGLYLSHNGHIYRLSLVDLPLTGEVTTQVEQVEE